MKWAAACVAMIGCGGLGSVPPAQDDAGPDAPPPSAAHIVTIPSAIDLGTVTSGYDTTVTTVAAINMGGQPSAALAAAVMPGFGFRITRSTCDGVELASGAACAIDLVANPTTPGAIDTTLVVGDAQVPLRMQAIAEAGFTLSPSTWTFSTIGPGLSETHRFMVTNIGGHPKGPLSIAKLGANPADFALAADSCTGATLAPAVACTFDVTFAPTIYGTLSADLEISGGATALAGVMGTSVSDPGGFISASPGSLDFGLVQTTTSMSGTFTVTNNGGGSTGAITVTPTGDSAFSAVSHCAAPLVGGESCTVDVTFAPTVAGSQQALILVAGTMTNTLMVPVMGVGHGPAQIAISPTVLQFGSTGIATTGMTRTVTVVNNAAVRTGALAVVKAGVDAGDFVLGADTCTGATLANGDTCHVDLTFSPTLPIGAKSATLAVSGFPGGMATATLAGDALSDGNGVVSVNPSSLDFGQVTAGATGTHAITLTNNGSLPTGAITVAHVGDATFTASPASCPALATGDTCTVDVTFAPITTGSQQATFTFNATPGGGAQVVAVGSGG